MHIEHFHLSQNGLPNVPVSTINLIKLHEFSHLFPNFLRWFGISDNFFMILESCYRLSVKYKQRFVFQISLRFSSLCSQCRLYVVSSVMAYAAVLTILNGLLAGWPSREIRGLIQLQQGEAKTTMIIEFQTFYVQVFV